MLWIQCKSCPFQKDSSPADASQKREHGLAACESVLTSPFSGRTFGEVWLPAQEFPWKWILSFSLFSPLKGIQETAPEQNTSHGVSRITKKKNNTIDFAAQQSAQEDFITENTFLDKVCI